MLHSRKDRAFVYRVPGVSMPPGYPDGADAGSDYLGTRGGCADTDVSEVSITVEGQGAERMRRALRWMNALTGHLLQVEAEHAKSRATSPQLPDGFHEGNLLVIDGQKVVLPPMLWRLARAAWEKSVEEDDLADLVCDHAKELSHGAIKAAVGRLNRLLVNAKVGSKVGFFHTGKGLVYRE